MRGVPHFLPRRPRSAQNDHRRIGRFTQEYHSFLATAGIKKPPCSAKPPSAWVLGTDLLRSLPDTFGVGQEVKEDLNRMHTPDPFPVGSFSTRLRGRWRHRGSPAHSVGSRAAQATRQQAWPTRGLGGSGALRTL